jgi:hypothetical protein
LETGFPASLEGFDGLLGGVPAVKELQCFLLKGLDTHADAVDGQLAEHGDILRCQVIGVGFEGDFRIFLYLIYIIYRGEDFFQFFLAELGWGATAQVDGFDVFAFQVVLSHVQFLAKCMYVCWLLLALCGGEEVAIDASAFAKRNMYVNACHVSLVLIPKIQDGADNLLGRVGKACKQVFVFSFLDEVFHQSVDGHFFCPVLLVHEYHRAGITETEVMVLHGFLKDFLHSAGACR